MGVGSVQDFQNQQQASADGTGYYNTDDVDVLDIGTDEITTSQILPHRRGREIAKFNGHLPLLERRCAAKRGIAFVESGYMSFRTNGVDTSADHAAALRGYIATHRQLIAQYDPDGLTADDQIDFASTVDARRAVGEFYRGRYVVFRLTDEGTADLMWGFETELEARRMLAGRPDHLVGRVCEDSWSVELLTQDTDQ